MNEKSLLNILKKYAIVFVQVLALIIVGIIVKDKYYMVFISVLGIMYNYFVSIGKKYAFIIGAIYAVLYGIMSYFEKVYASAFFMILIQLPSTIISYITWGKVDNANKMKAQKWWQSLVTLFALILSTVGIYYLLKFVNGSGAIFDAFFFACSAIACLLLIFKYREAYVVILLSGIGGSALWLYQFIATGQGISVFLLNLFVLINAIIAIVLNYIKGKNNGKMENHEAK